MSYRYDNVYYFDEESLSYSEGDGSWSKNWEARSQQRGTPSHIKGWKAGEYGSLLRTPIIRNSKAHGSTEKIPPSDFGFTEPKSLS